MIEITESLFISDLEVATSILSSIKELGINTSLDDFGTGYSSLSLLNKLPINEIKIDKSFIQDILSDKQSRALVESIIGIGKNLSIPVIAEGVESQEQETLLEQCGCDLFQGYYFSKPLSKVQLLDFINNYKSEII